MSSAPKRETSIRRTGTSLGYPGRRDDVDAYSRRPEPSRRARERPVDQALSSSPLPQSQSSRQPGRPDRTDYQRGRFGFNGSVSKPHFNHMTSRNDHGDGGYDATMGNRRNADRHHAPRDIYGTDYSTMNPQESDKGVRNNPLNSDHPRRNSYGEDHFGKNSYGEDHSGKNSYGEDHSGKNSYGEDQAGRNSYGASDANRNTYRENHSGRNLHGNDYHSRNKIYPAAHSFGNDRDSRNSNISDIEPRDNGNHRSYNHQKHTMQYDAQLRNASESYGSYTPDYKTRSGEGQAYGRGRGRYVGGRGTASLHRPRNARGIQDSYRAHHDGPSHRRQEQYHVPVKQEPKPSHQQAINRLAQLKDVPPISAVQVMGSRWGVRPKGFENVSAQRAKLLGLFPLPGHPRPVDFTKLEGLVKDGLDGYSDILIDASHIDTHDSRVARTLVVSGVDFSQIDYLKVCQYWNDYLRRVDYGEASATENVTEKRKTKDDKTLIVEFKTSELATLVFCLRHEALPYNLFLKDGTLNKNAADSFYLRLERPLEYVVGHDQVGQIAVRISPEMSESELETIVHVSAPQLSTVKIVREIGTKKSLGIGLIDTAGIPTPGLLESLQAHGDIKEAFYSVSPDTSVQQCAADYVTLPKMARNEQVTPHPRLRVVVLLNMLAVKDLMSDETYLFIHQDITEEATQYGKVLSVKIPRPAHNYCPGLQQFVETGLGRVYIKFQEESMAVRAIMELAGRQYNDRTVLCALHSERDYDLGLF